MVLSFSVQMVLILNRLVTGTVTQQTGSVTEYQTAVTGVTRKEAVIICTVHLASLDVYLGNALLSLLTHETAYSQTKF